MNPYRLIFTFVLLCPYFIFYRMNNKETPIWQDMIFAALAFGIGYAIFPDKKKPPTATKSDKDLIDRE